tara:strand:- start:470 stop:646 length:177 start_codon:yes stop_codon:yes gene_type:complete
MKDYLVTIQADQCIAQASKYVQANDKEEAEELAWEEAGELSFELLTIEKLQIFKIAEV